MSAPVLPCSVQLVLGGAVWSTCKLPARHAGWHDGKHPTQPGLVQWSGGEPTPCVVRAEMPPAHTTLHTAGECSNERGCFL